MNHFAIHNDEAIITMTSPETNIIFTDENEYFQPVREILTCAMRDQGTTCIDLDESQPNEYCKLQAYVDYACVVE